MKTKQKKDRALLQSYRRYTMIPAFTLGIVVALTALFILLYSFTGIVVFLYVYGGIILVSLIAYLIFYFRLSKAMKSTYYKQLYETTYENITKLANNDVNLSSYGKSDIKEIQALDKATQDIKAKFASAYLMITKADYSNIPLEYIDKDNGLITNKSFRDNLANIIYVSQSFRNVIIEVYFALPNDTRLSKKDKTRLLKLYREAFLEHENVLYSFADDERSLFIYVPVIDSFSEIKEKLNFVVSSSSVMVRDDRGIRNILAQYAIVAYPYSSEDMLLGDLRYAKRQNKPYFLFLPERFKTSNEKKLLVNTSMNLNYASKVMTELSKLDYSAVDNEKNETVLKTVFNSISNLLDIDEAGIIVYNDSTDSYVPYISSSRSNLFISGSVNKEVVERLASVVDDDNSYYFSARKHANKNIQQLLGLYGVESGTYYVVRDFNDEGIYAIIYLLNRNKNMFLNSYLRETFFIISLRIENYFEKSEIADYANSKHNENENILALSNMLIYHVDDDFNITYLSKGFKRAFKGAEIGEKCYKAFYDKDSRCKDCPLISKKKKYHEGNNGLYEVSLTLAERKDKNHVMLIKQINSTEEAGDLYQDDLLTYSYRSLVNMVRNEYIANGRGYVILLTVDNYEEIVKKLGSEGYSYLLRDYIRNLKNKLHINDIYYYNPSTLAIHLPYLGHKDVIDNIELIYPLSKAGYYDNKDFAKLNISYLPVGYPRGYAYAEDFLKHMSDFYHDPVIERNKDFIYFADLSIARSASKHDFMVSVLEQEFSTHNSTSMNLQPIVRLSDGHIFGAEILLRIADAHRNVFFNAQEISDIAKKEHKTGLITESILNFVGNMYKDYGGNIFKINKFNRIAINIDQTYLEDTSMITNLIKICEDNNLPNGFISLEIPEDVIPEYKDHIKQLASTMSKYKMLLSCDRYMSQYITIEELKELGFKEVKVARDIILTVDKDPVKYDALKQIVETSKLNNMHVAAVGVENEQQLKMLKALDEDMVAQGYFLYKPLTRADLIAALISYDK